MRFLPSLLVAAACATGCVSEDAKGDEEDLPEDGKLDSFQKPTDHGAIAFDEAAHAVLTDDERHHTWTFTLSGDARVDMTTSYSILGQRKTDTVLYLYRKGPTGWGSYIARNDDYEGKVYSQLIRDLGAGDYRVLVKGYLASTRGKFKITVGCDGVGCEPPAPPAGACLFGATYGELAANPALVVDNTNVITAATLGTLTAADQQHLLDAVRQSSHTDVTTPLEAIGRVDGGEVNVTWLHEPAARRSFIAFEYGAGDNSYGAIFDRHTGRMATAIHDGDLVECVVETETCRLPEDYTALRNDATFTLQEERVITSASQLEGIEVEQVLGALRRVYGPATVPTVAAGLAMADDDRVNFRVYLDHGSNTDLAVVELGAGDTSVGTIYYWRSLQVAGVISDLFIEGCSLFAPKGGVPLGGACRGAGDCVTGLMCTGVFAGQGVCNSTADVPGEDAACDADADCGSAALVCAGAPFGGGHCNPAWMRGTFEDPSTTPVPDGGTLSSRVVVRGLATVDTDVIVRARIEHPAASQLLVTLVNGRGTEVLVHTGVAADDGAALVLEEPVGFAESANGEWTLRVEDRTTGQTGQLAGWSLTVTTRWD